MLFFKWARAFKSAKKNMRDEILVWTLHLIMNHHRTRFHAFQGIEWITTELQRIYIKYIKIRWNWCASIKLWFHCMKSISMGHLIDLIALTIGPMFSTHHISSTLIQTQCFNCCLLKNWLPFSTSLLLSTKITTK